MPTELDLKDVAAASSTPDADRLVTRRFQSPPAAGKKLRDPTLSGTSLSSAPAYYTPGDAARSKCSHGSALARRLSPSRAAPPGPRHLQGECPRPLGATGRHCPRCLHQSLLKSPIPLPLTFRWQQEQWERREQEYR